MSRRWGIPIQGSKNKIAEWVISVLPPAEHLYDVFCGGGAVTHCALMSSKWRRVHFSDISDTATCVRDLLEGNIPDGSEWISREDFYRRMSEEPWIRVLWSFSNNQRDYLYSRKLEPYKKAVHEMIFAPTPTERRLKFREVCRLIPSVWGGGWNDNSTTTNPRSGFSKLPPPESRIYSTWKDTRASVQDAVNGSSTPPIISNLQARTDGKNRGGGGTKDCSLRSEERSVNMRPFVKGSMNVA